MGDFIDLLNASGYVWGAPVGRGAAIDTSKGTQGTTVLAFHYKDGALIAGDRRATAGSSIMYDRCDKVIPLDDYTLMAIAGVPATAFEMGRILSHNFEYYRRSQLQSLSAEGKIRALSKLLQENVGNALQGVGAVSPILATWDTRENKPEIYFYDLLGAQFDLLTHTANGAGPRAPPGSLHHRHLDGCGRRPVSRDALQERFTQGQDQTRHSGRGQLCQLASAGFGILQESGFR